MFTVGIEKRPTINIEMNGSRDEEFHKSQIYLPLAPQYIVKFCKEKILDLQEILVKSWEYPLF